MADRMREPGGASASDQDVHRARRGDVRAFERLYQGHSGKVHALSLRMMRDHARAEDATQEIFIKAWKSLPTFRGESAFSTWLYRLAVNHLLFVIRTDKRRSARVAGGESYDEAPAVAPPPRHDVRIDLDDALASLPDGARIVLMMHDVQGFNHEEIGQALGVTSGTSKSQLHRARQLLRAALGEATP